MARKPRKRANGEGTITRRSDGRWEGRISLGYHPDGRRNRPVVYGATQREVREELDRLKLAAASGGLEDTKWTVAEYLEYWHKEKARNWKPRTTELYRHLNEKHINPQIGQIKLAALTPRHVQAMVGSIADSGSKRTANQCRTQLFSALKQAVRWELLSRNVVEAVDPLKVETKIPELWTPEQVRTFLEAAEEHKLYAAFFVLITTGLRRGELLGLRWVDLKDNALHIKQALTLVGNTPTISSTKTKKGERIVHIAPDALDILNQHKELQDKDKEYLGESWTETDLIFASEVGTPLHPRNFTRVWKSLQKNAEVPEARIHDLRHLHVSLLIRTGLDAKTIADRVGHTDPAFTLRRYAHLFDEQRRRAAINLDDLLNFEKQDEETDEDNAGE